MDGATDRFGVSARSRRARGRARARAWTWTRGDGDGREWGDEIRGIRSRSCARSRVRARGECGVKMFAVVRDARLTNDDDDVSSPGAVPPIPSCRPTRADRDATRAGSVPHEALGARCRQGAIEVLVRWMTRLRRAREVRTRARWGRSRMRRRRAMTTEH